MRKPLSQYFKTGQLAEARSFQDGFRGAWFRCKIKRVVRKKGRITAYSLEYYDYDKEHETVDLYASSSESSSGQKAKRELMLRPQFPVFYRESDLPDVNTVSDVIVAVADVSSVGDLVDWFFDGCFWTGTITEIMDDERVKVDLLKPPRGEGSSYVVDCKDLRPSLDWSPEFGWTVPVPLECQSGHLHARIIQPLKQAKSSLVVTPRSSLESSHTSVSSLPLSNSSRRTKDSLQRSIDISKKGLQEIGASITGKPSCSDNVSGTYVEDAQAEVVAVCAEQQDHKNGCAKKMRLKETITLNSTACDSIESAILDLEELVNRVKWLKQILKLGISTTPQAPTWEFLTPK